MEHEQYINELKHMRDLCVKLDKDKDILRNELLGKEDRRTQVIYYYYLCKLIVW